jgi:N-acetyl-anhydromuramyl-L-alanine amidase AmpD
VSALQRCAALVLLLPFLQAGCRAPTGDAAPLPRPGHAILVRGERFATGAPVVLWFEEPHYDGYATEPRFDDVGPVGLRYRPGRNALDAGGRPLDPATLDLDALRDVVDLFVLHYDVSGTSRECFRVLQDERELSVHFLLDVDGTVYQTLDLQEQAWHARQANPRSIGIEIAQIGAYPPDEAEPLERWYAEEEAWAQLTIPEHLEGGGVRMPFSGRAARPRPITGSIQGVEYVQYDFTPEQYESLVALTATLAEVFPRIALDAPRDAQGVVRTDVLSDAELDAFSGVVGHYHVSADKRDPGPAFDWERFLAEVRALAAYSP